MPISSYFRYSFNIFIFLLPLTSQAEAGPVQLVTQNTGKCLDINGSATVDGTPVVQQRCDGRENQNWRFVNIAPAEYQIVLISSGLCLDVSGASQNDGARVKLSVCAGVTRKNQLWRMSPTPNGMQKIISVNSSKCLDMPLSALNLAPAQQWTCGPQKSQIWDATSTALVESGPVTITQSNTILRNLHITNPNGPCIQISGSADPLSNITIRDSDIGPCAGTGTFINSGWTSGTITNVGIDHVTFHDLGAEAISMVSTFPAPAGNWLSINNSTFKNLKSDGIVITSYNTSVNPSAQVPSVSITKNVFQDLVGRAVKIYGAPRASVQYNYFTRLQGGVFMSKVTGAKINNNRFAHIRGGTVRTNLMQFVGVSGPGNSISCNIGEQDLPGTPHSLDSVEDQINIYESSGTVESPIQVIGNKLKGGGPSPSGGGITVADGNLAGQYILVQDNVTVDTGVGGVGSAGGKFVSLLDNQIFSTPNAVNWVGLTVINFTGSLPCSDITVTGNHVNWTNRWGPDTNGHVSGCSNVTWDRNIFQDPTITAAIYDTYTSSHCPVK
jgi:hypothetical protein